MQDHITSLETRIVELEAMAASLGSFLRETAQARSLADLNVAAGGTLEDAATMLPGAPLATANAALLMGRPA